jgi:hypothetical protein
MGGWFGRFFCASLKWDGPYPRWFEDWVDPEGQAAIIRWWEPGRAAVVVGGAG